ncbi:restriction endonuclease subunit S [Coprobacillus sp. AM32-11LB]|nr:restriction endonuclease subunit S [Coprobacillus sp. AM32-11LB]
MKENKTKPDIRFKGFTEAWEQRKLGDVTQIIMGQSPDGSTYSEKPKDYILVQGNSDIKDGWVEPRLWTTQMTKKADVGDLIMSVRAPAGSMGKTAYNVVIGRGVAAIKGNEFIFQSLIKKDIEGFWKKITTGSTFESLNSNDIKNSNLLVPVNEEQIKIGQYFSQLDNLITLHQRECDQLKELKKSMLKKMFPRDESSIPEVRFAGFTDAWEQRKVSKITKFHKQGFYTIEDYNDNKKYYLLRGTDFSENKLLLKDTPKINATKKDYEAFKTELGDFLIVRSGTVGTYGIVDVDIPAIFGSYLIDFRFDMEQVTNEFFGYFYQSDLFKSQLNKIIQTSANTNINAENIKSTVISLPNLDEQRKISEYLGNLDHLITLHQRELEILKNLKKTCLKRMFI